MLAILMRFVLWAAAFRLAAWVLHGLHIGGVHSVLIPAVPAMADGGAGFLLAEHVTRHRRALGMVRVAGRSGRYHAASHRSDACGRVFSRILFIGRLLFKPLDARMNRVYLPSFYHTLIVG